MKTRTTVKRWSAVVLAGVSLALCPTRSLAVGDLILNTFDSAAELTAQDNDWGGASATWDGTADAGGGASPGALHVVIPYSNPDPTSWQETQVGRNFPWNNDNYQPLGSYAFLEYDVKVDTANSPFPASDGTWAICQPIVQQWDWTPLGEVQINNTGWVHVKQSVAGVNKLAHLVLSFHAKWGVYTTNAIAYWIDNVKLTVPPAGPPTMAMDGKAKPGLHTFTYIQAGADVNQRQGISTVGSNYKWYDAAGDVTYSFTITDYPKLANYSTHLLLIAGAIDAPTRADPDWHEATVLRLDVGVNGDGTAYSNVRYKTNAPDSNGTFYGDGNLAGAGSATVLGTWTLKFTHNTNATVISPDNTVNTVVIPPDVAAYFNNAITVNLGVGVGNAGNGTNIAAAVFSNAKITGTPSTLDTPFTGSTLDASWEAKANTPSFIKQVPADAALWVKWTQPDNGFLPQGGSSVTGPWTDIATTPLLFGGDYKRLLLTTSQLPSANAGFFRLIKRSFAKLQILLPGETAAPGTPTGKTGTPTAQVVNTPFNVTVRAVSADWYPISGITDTIHFTSTDGLAFVPPDGGLANGTGTFSMMFGADGSWTITASDVTDGTKTSDTSSSVTVTP